MRDQRTDTNAVRLLRDLIEPWNSLKVHQIGIVQRSLLHQNYQGGPARDWPSLIAVLQQEVARLREGTWLQEIERSNRHDGFHRN
jgi:hypothetical protein